MICCVFAGLVEHVFLRIGSAETDDLLCVAGLVERVFLRIGSAETDEQLELALTKFLPPVILKLDSKEEGVRKKVCHTFSGTKKFYCMTLLLISGNCNNKRNV